MKTDFLVIGSGAAGLSFAIKASKLGSVSLITKRQLIDSNTAKAQGGIAVVTRKDDSFRSHINDTLIAGAGLCKREVVELTVEGGPSIIAELEEWGVKFSRFGNKQNADYEFGLEGGHSKRRILHCADATGFELQKVLIAKAKKCGIKFYENHTAIDLITSGKLKKNFQKNNERCFGAYVLSNATGEVNAFTAKMTVLATGGAGKVYLYTSNPDIAAGDGVAMAYRCGATVANMEFVQFHPTCLFNEKERSFLISEALRGEGAVLRLKNGKKFMHKYHPLKELAPRDIVARAIGNELKILGDDFVYLDITSKSSVYLKKRFPTIYAKCLECGIDISKNPIPVVPAEHYSCGGVLTDTFAQTNINGLFAIGECACTGLHGANRLASNSLLEAMVFARRAYQKANELVSKKINFPIIPQWDKGNAKDSDESVVIKQNWDEIRNFMWNYVGIVRTDKRLKRAFERIKLLKKEIQEYYWNFFITSDLIELRNIATVAEIIIKSAIKRKESRGLHYNLDHPSMLKKPKDTLIKRF